MSLPPGEDLDGVQVNSAGGAQRKANKRRVGANEPGTEDGEGTEFAGGSASNEPNAADRDAEHLNAGLEEAGDMQAQATPAKKKKKKKKKKKPVD